MSFPGAALPITRSAASKSAVHARGATMVTGFRSWKDFVHDNFPWLEHRDHSGGEFRAEVSAYHLGSSALTTINASASEVIRTRCLADRAESGFIKLMWQMAGGIDLEQDNRRCTLEPGQAAVCDTTRPYRIRLSEGAHLAVLMLPHDACPGWERISQRICGARLGDSVTMCAAFGALMALSGIPDEGANCTGDTALRAIQWMITTSLHRSVNESTVGNLHNVRLHKAQQHILEHIADPQFRADELAAALCMSRRSLYMLFKEYRLTPGKMIHELRLEQSRQALGDVGQQHRKITDIAFDHGFSDYGTFSRLFKTHFGLTPSEYRLKARAPHG